MTFMIFLISLLIASVLKLFVSIEQVHSVTSTDYLPKPSDQFQHFGGWGSIQT